MEISLDQIGCRRGRGAAISRIFRVLANRTKCHHAPGLTLLQEPVTGKLDFPRRSGWQNIQAELDRERQHSPGLERTEILRTTVAIVTAKTAADVPWMRSALPRLFAIFPNEVRVAVSWEIVVDNPFLRKPARQGG